MQSRGRYAWLIAFDGLADIDLRQADRRRTRVLGALVPRSSQPVACLWSEQATGRAERWSADHPSPSLGALV